MITSDDRVQGMLIKKFNWHNIIGILNTYGPVDY